MRNIVRNCEHSWRISNHLPCNFNIRIQLNVITNNIYIYNKIKKNAWFFDDFYFAFNYFNISKMFKQLKINSFCVNPNRFQIQYKTFCKRPYYVWLLSWLCRNDKANQLQWQRRQPPVQWVKITVLCKYTTRIIVTNYFPIRFVKHVGWTNACNSYLISPCLNYIKNFCFRYHFISLYYVPKSTYTKHLMYMREFKSTFLCLLKRPMQGCHLWKRRDVRGYS